MNIYQPTWLYIKEHSVTGLRYFGKTIKNPYKYNGSGIRWSRHLKLHGTDIKTIWAKQFDSLEEVTEFALAFSELYDIVNSASWANLCPENGTDGGYRSNNHCKILNASGRSTEQRNKISNTLLGTKNRAVPISINGIIYSSMRDAATKLGKVEMTIYNWIKSGKAIKMA